ncbi:MAG: LytTR family DNA-binding domain-containing protein [Ignavibacteria bacterium]|jgi:two-component system LytT family response regulator|nr:LytTR family DNA-binding domain-containing protein [Ignavibacteria bacterium]
MKRKFDAVIVDDERLARKELISMLKEYPEINVIAEAGSADTAEDIINNNKPDVIFLDIQMPGKSGITLLEKISPDIKIIFVTAYDEYAIKAFEINALDYLLKPVNPARLKNSIQRLFQNIAGKQLFSMKFEYEDSIFLLVNSQMRFIKVNSIVTINASGDYTEILTSDSVKGLTSKSMREWEKRLPENHFARIHRSFIINLNHVRKIEELLNHSFNIYIKGIEQPYKMSRRYARLIKEKLG